MTNQKYNPDEERYAIGDRTTPRKSNIIIDPEAIRKMNEEAEEEDRLEEIAKRKKEIEDRKKGGKGKTKPNPETKIEPNPFIPANISPSDYITLPSGLLVSKEKTLYGKNWFEAHKELQAQGLRMLTIPEFWEFTNYLKTDYQKINKKEANKILENIFKIGDWRGEWLDADFKVNGDELFINFYHLVDSDGNLIPQNSEKLEDCLMEDVYAELSSINKQGLLTEKSKKQEYIQGKNVYSYYPRSDNNSVARFDADSGGAGLYCIRIPDGGYSSLGVRCALKGRSTDKQSGGLK